MLSLRTRRTDTPQGRQWSWGSAVVAVALTCGWMTGIALAWRQPVSAPNAGAAYDGAARREEVVRLTLPTPPAPPSTSAPQVPATPRSPLRAVRKVDERTAPQDTGGRPTAAAPAAPTVPPTGLDPMAPVATRLTPAPSAGTPWYGAPAARIPSLHGEQAPRAERDSMLTELGRQFSELVARRIPTEAERDARAKEALLKMRLSGRILLVPPDNSGGIIKASIPFGWLGGRWSSTAERRAAAQRPDRLIQERLRQRADSLRRARSDSTSGIATP
jgi:hypothetical protein